MFLAPCLFPWKQQPPQKRSWQPAPGPSPPPAFAERQELNLFTTLIASRCDPSLCQQKKKADANQLRGRKTTMGRAGGASSPKTPGGLMGELEPRAGRQGPGSA